MENFKSSLLRMNVTRNCHVTTDDLNIAKKTFGPDVSSLKGKSARGKPKPVRKDTIEIPTELIVKHHKIKLWMDTMHVNKWGMLTAIDRTTKCQSLIPIAETRQHKELQQTLIPVESDQSNATRSTPCAVTRALSASPTSSHCVTRVRAASSSNRRILRDCLPSSLE
jgi:hypothetical protein